MVYSIPWKKIKIVNVEKNLNLVVTEFVMAKYILNTFVENVRTRGKSNMTFSLNNRLILEPYVKEGLKAKVSGGIAIPGQRDGIKGLKVLLDAYLSDGRKIPAGSTAYIREEVLHTHLWASKPLNWAGPGNITSFLIVESSYIEFYDTGNAP